MPDGSCHCDRSVDAGLCVFGARLVRGGALLGRPTIAVRVCHARACALLVREFVRWTEYAKDEDVWAQEVGADRGDGG